MIMLTHTQTYDQRSDILSEAQSAYFIIVVMTQWSDVVVCKTRRLSLFQHGFE